MIDPRTLRAGDLLNPNDNYSYHHFVEWVDDLGVHISLVSNLGIPEQRYTKLAGHDGYIPFSATWHRWDRHTKAGSIPALIGKHYLNLKTGRSG